jgi:uncharacterized NAD(P)/FAD-binding protein YdhS
MSDSIRPDSSDWHEAMAEISNLRSDLAAALKDAERYRWLRNTPPWKATVNVIYAQEVADDVVLLTLDGLDDAIDAAISAKPVNT